MAWITYVDHDGTERTFDVKPGLSLMEGGVRNGVEGIAAECGGACACATCHVYISEEWAPLTGTPSEMESSMLEYAAHVRQNSRLSCQITVSEAMDGLRLNLPESQG